MIVVGGVYREICVDADIDELYGSGGRAAAAIASTGCTVELHTCAADAHLIEISDAIEPSGASLVVHPSSDLVRFRYLHSLAKPIFYPFPLPVAKDVIVASGDDILVFGMMEGKFRVSGKRVVFDPQSSDPLEFKSYGSKAKHLSVILNAHELRKATRASVEGDAVRALAADLGADVVIVKGGGLGANVYVSGALVGSIAPYKSERVYKIGSGDIFSSAFAHASMNLKLKPLAAADYASRSTARYCETRSATLVPVADLSDLSPIKGMVAGKIYIASPFFNLADLWLVEELARAIAEVGCEPFSPFHEIGIGPAHYVAPADLEALEAASSVLAVTSGGDPGTLFEVGYAVSRGIPVIILGQNVRKSDITMPVGTGCFATPDIATAVYRACWAARR